MQKYCNSDCGTFVIMQKCHYLNCGTFVIVQKRHYLDCGTSASRSSATIEIADGVFINIKTKVCRLLFCKKMITFAR